MLSLTKKLDIKDCYKTMIIADLHFDKHEPAVLSIFKQVYDDYKKVIDEIDYLGDEADFNAFSKFKTVVKYKENPLKQISMFAEFSSYFNDKKQIRHGSNHIDARIDSYCELHPELEFVMEDIRKKLNVNIHTTTEYGESFFPFAEYGNNKIRLTHGKYLSAKAYAEKSRVDTIFGHIHSQQIHVSPIKSIAYAMPCACKIDPKYMLGLESSWNQGFAILSYYPKINDYNLEYIIVKDNKAIYRDKIYYAEV